MYNCQYRILIISFGAKLRILPTKKNVEIDERRVQLQQHNHAVYHLLVHLTRYVAVRRHPPSPAPAARATRDVSTIVWPILYCYAVLLYCYTAVIAMYFPAQVKKKVILSRYEKLCVFCVRDKLTNQINAVSLYPYYIPYGAWDQFALPSSPGCVNHCVAATIIAFIFPLKSPKRGSSRVNNKNARIAKSYNYKPPYRTGRNDMTICSHEPVGENHGQDTNILFLALFRFFLRPFGWKPRLWYYGG